MSYEDELDKDNIETKEWLLAFRDVIKFTGIPRAQFLLSQLLEEAKNKGLSLNYSLNTPYKNTLLSQDLSPYPGDQALEERLEVYIRWNAVAMVLRAGQIDPDLGGHIGTFASSATLYSVGFNHFFKASNDTEEGDLIYYQGHASPGMYARSFLEGVLSEEKLINFRQEVQNQGLSSYPHPWLMPNYWQFPTVSMGLGPLQAIYQARFMRYLQARNLGNHQARHVWCFCGDGEMDEPESLGAISLAGREKLDNLIFVINCNLQRLDGPVRGNGKIIQELESVFKGAGWNVIKVIWSSDWDELFEKDKSKLLLKRMEEVVDGEYQGYKAHGGAYKREAFFGKYPELLELVKDLSDEQIQALRRGGHDPLKVYQAYLSALNHQGQPTVILAKTVKGYGLGKAGEALNTAHNTKKMAYEDLKIFRDRFNIPINDEELKSTPFYKPDENSPEIQYLKKQRQKLNGFLPSRRLEASEKLIMPDLNQFKTLLEGSGERKISTTMAFVRLITQLCKDKNIGNRVVPIVPDEARTFGMEGLFRQLGIYSPLGQLYKPVDANEVMFYKESKNGQILEEGINEGGAFCSWMAAACSYSNHNKVMIPFYIYYSMFGFQRIGDLAWAAGDARARGFLIGATSGRTTLNGEGLQHEDGHSHLLANTIPNCISYDPSFAYELAVIIQSGLKRMYEDQDSVYYYITTMNENYLNPPMKAGMEEGIIKGMYCLEEASDPNNEVQLLGSGAILLEVIAAQKILKTEFNVNASIWSVTSFNECAREGQAIERWNLLHPTDIPKKAYVTQLLEKTNGPIIAATDYMRAYAEQIRSFVPRNYTVMGTDGFGRSDTRVKLRSFFEVSRYYIVVAALGALSKEGKFPVEQLQAAMQKFQIDPEKPNPLMV
ncbi:MAG: pyruvate dehydrogenase component, homodimeric type [Francisellaceae bacterium]|nr:pyruvate dehydrogenase component, homodimeric type [Francisellaceae bacterium]